MIYPSLQLTAEEEYEENWYLETVRDHEKKELFPAIMTENCDEAILDAFVANFVEMGKKCEERWADGRQYVAGNTMSAADFVYLAGHTMIHGNTGLRNPSLAAKFEAAAPMANAPNCMRILNKMKEHCQATVDALQPTWI